MKAIASKQTKTQIITALSESIGLSKKDWAVSCPRLAQWSRAMKKRGSGEFTIPDTGVKIRRVKKPARQGLYGPQSGDQRTNEDRREAGIDSKFA